MSKKSVIIIAIAAFLTLSIVCTRLVWDTAADIAYVLEVNS